MTLRSLLICVVLVVGSILAALLYWRAAHIDQEVPAAERRDLFGSPVVGHPEVQHLDPAAGLDPPSGLSESTPADGVRLDGPVGEPEVGPEQPWEPPEIMAYA